MIKLRKKATAEFNKHFWNKSVERNISSFYSINFLNGLLLNSLYNFSEITNDISLNGMFYKTALELLKPLT